jgi:DNA-binding GntR family transcriptional regulator
MAQSPTRRKASHAVPAAPARTAGVQSGYRIQVPRTALKRGAATRQQAPAAPANLAQSVYDRLKNDIFEFRLAPGGRFSENQVAARTGVSRTPVREALYRLAREGFLEVHAKSGWSVRALDFDRFDQLYDIRVILELAAVQKLCEGEPVDTLTALRKVWLVSARARSADGRVVAALDEQFHSTLVTATGNQELARIHADTTERIRIVRRLDFTQSERIARTYDEHAAILRAILTRKVQQAGMLLRAHIEESKLEVRKISLHMLHLAQREGARQG